MTLCIAWHRRRQNAEDICVIADSCFTGNQKFLAAPKIFMLDRKDCVLACAGNTAYSFSVVEHVRNAISLNQGLRDRSIDITDLLHAIRDIANKVLIQETEEQHDANPGPGFVMLIAGYSWKFRKPIIRELHYREHQKLMMVHTPKTIKGVPFSVIGDEVGKVRHDIYLRLESDGVVQNGCVDMQPLDVLMKYINDIDIDCIGGVPQMVRIYPHMNTLPIGFMDKEKNLYYFGRPLIKYETFPYPIIDLETKEQKYMKGILEEFERKPEEAQPLKKFKRYVRDGV